SHVSARDASFHRAIPADDAGPPRAAAGREGRSLATPSMRGSACHKPRIIEGAPRDAACPLGSVVTGITNALLRRVHLTVRHAQMVLKHDATSELETADRACSGDDVLVTHGRPRLC